MKFYIRTWNGFKYFELIIIGMKKEKDNKSKKEIDKKEDEEIILEE